MLFGLERSPDELTNNERKRFKAWKMERAMAQPGTQESVWWPVVERELRVPGVTLSTERVKATCREAAATGKRTALEILQAVRRATAILTTQHMAGKVRAADGFFETTLRNEIVLPKRSRKDKP